MTKVKKTNGWEVSDMSEYTKNLTAEQLIRYIASDRVELSHDKVLWQRNDFMRICQEWLEHNGSRDEPDDAALTQSQQDQIRRDAGGS
jgi:hypothetical protein